MSAQPHPGAVHCRVVPATGSPLRLATDEVAGHVSTSPATGRRVLDSAPAGRYYARMRLLTRLRHRHDDLITAWARRARYGTFTESVSDDADYFFTVQAHAEDGAVVRCELVRRAEEDQGPTCPLGIVRRPVPTGLAAMLVMLGAPGQLPAERMELRAQLMGDLNVEVIDLLVPVREAYGPRQPDQLLRAAWEAAGDGRLAAVALR